jgi:hypothetical protein
VRWPCDKFSPSPIYHVFTKKLTRDTNDNALPFSLHRGSSSKVFADFLPQTSASCCCCWTSRGLLFPTVIATWNYRVWILEGGSVSCRITQVDGRIWLLIFLDIYSFGYSDILSETCKCWMKEETLKVSKQMKKKTISLGDTSSHLFGTNSSNLDCLT